MYTHALGNPKHYYIPTTIAQAKYSLFTSLKPSSTLTLLWDWFTHCQAPTYLPKHTNNYVAFPLGALPPNVAPRCLYCSAKMKEELKHNMLSEEAPTKSSMH